MDICIILQVCVCVCVYNFHILWVLYWRILKMWQTPLLKYYELHILSKFQIHCMIMKGQKFGSSILN